MTAQTTAIPTADKQVKPYVNSLNRSLGVFFKNAWRISLTNPAQAFYFTQVARYQMKAAGVRSKMAKQGVHVPPIMIFSITNRCNLHCKGCYAQALRPAGEAEMSESKMRGIISEAHDLGISFMVIAGGEPLVRKEILDITREFPDILFLMFTNGMLIDDEVAHRIKMQRNLVPLISMEGYEKDTDERRGSGVYERLQQTVDVLNRNNIFFGTSLTVTSANFSTITDVIFIEKLNKAGGKFFMFIEYTPVKEGTEDWVITDEQRAQLADRMRDFRERYSALFISVPGDEEDFGGCLAAGRGFVHVNAAGDLEPCPFVPFSDASLKDKSLKDALQSPFLRALRENPEGMSEGRGGCALWEKRAWLNSLLDGKKE